MEHDEVITSDSMESRLSHLASNINCYKVFHTGDILKDAEKCFKYGLSCEDVLNLIVVATAKALNLKLSIYQKGLKGNIQILLYTTHVTAKEVHLKFTCDPSNVANNHYEALLFLNKSTESHTEQEVSIESPSTLEQPIRLGNLDDVIDLTDDSEMTTSQQSHSLENDASNNELQFPTQLFVNMATEWVDDMPYDINGFKLYKLKCSSHEWVQKSQDMYYFKMHSSRWKNLIRTRKAGRCIGNLYCAFDEYPFNLTLQTSRIWLDTRFAPAVAMLPVGSGVVHIKWLNIVGSPKASQSIMLVNTCAPWNQTQ